MDTAAVCSGERPPRPLTAAHICRSLRSSIMLRGFLHRVPAEVPEGKRLHIAHLIRWEHYEEAHAATQRRFSLHDRISECSEYLWLTHGSGLGYGDNFVAIVESGMDCDCVQYSGKVSLVRADWRAVQEHIDHASKWADGPISFGIMPPSEAQSVRYWSRDRVAEAHENGHPWSV
jgi:hypothetical protein